MDNLRRWQLGSGRSLYLAADARLSRTNYTDDQSWCIIPGEDGAPALRLQTRYGGRVGQATIIPIWNHGGRSIYDTQTYAQPPRITTFAPGYAHVEGQLTVHLRINADYHVSDSQIIRGRFSLTNEGDTDESLHIDLLGQVIIRSKEQRLAILSLSDATSALSMGKLPNLEPVLLFEDAIADLDTIRVSPKIGRNVTIPAGETVHLNWVHAGLSTTESSLNYAQQMMLTSWDEVLDEINRAAERIPQIETGDERVDFAIARSYHDLLQAFIDPTDKIPHQTFVATRHPDKGYSANDGIDYGRGWSGASAHTSYLTTLATATIDAKRAQGLIRNWLANQQKNGWIDARPGAAGQTSDTLCPPMLARLTWSTYQYTRDDAFLKEVLPKLLNFFRRWFQSDMDLEYDGLPEWQTERQMGYTFFPTFATTNWGQSANIRFFETPDLVAHLLSEALSLTAIAHQIGESVTEASINERIQKLQSLLDEMWHENRYAYRDRDTNTITYKETILTEGTGDDEHILAYTLQSPARIIVHVQGGTSKMPNGNLTIQGKDWHGNPITEAVQFKDGFQWSYGGGNYTSRHAYSEIDSIQCQGLSRIFKISANTVDCTRLDINALMPLWSGGIPNDRAEALIALLTDEDHFWRSSGVTLVSAQDPNYDPTSANGGGGTWLFWTTALGEGLLDYGRHDIVTEMLRRILNVQAQVLDTDNELTEFYHSDEPRGLGEKDYLSGIVPLHLLTRALGVYIVSNGAVWTGGAFNWDQPVTVRRNGVTVIRSKNGTQITFPSGHTVELDSKADWQHITDPNATPEGDLSKSLQIEPAQTASNRVIIGIDNHENEEDDE